MFIVLLKFSDNKAKAGEFMDGHKLWLKQGFDDGIFLIAGSLTPKAGGGILAHNVSLNDLQSKVSGDPFVSENIVTAEILEIIPSKADARLNFLLQEQNMSKTIEGPDGNPRCSWCAAAPEFFDYHDKEWGFPVDDDQRLFEKLCLESFQSGLSWRTILAKRENFRMAFDSFDFNKIARYREKDIERLLGDEGIVRHRGKIDAVINNACRTQEMVKQEGSLAAYFWGYEPDETRLATPQTASTSDTSKAIAKDLKKRGWKFVGPTTVYAFMQAMGLINDHAEGCIIRGKVEKARKAFVRP